MKNTKYILTMLIGVLFLFNSCQKDQHDLGDLVAPSNVNLTYEIVGVDAENPNGDGSGLVNFTATADNEITFTFDFGDGKDKQVVTNGKTTHQFSINGTVTYNVTVSAVGTGGISSTKTAQVEVFSSFSDDEALQFLTGGDSKSWFWAADLPGFVGLGPTTQDDGNAEFTYAAWYSITPWDTDKACMYDNTEFVFTKTNNGMTFEQISGPAFIPGTYAGDLGVGGDVCIGEDIAPNLYGVKNVSFSPSSSIASIAGGYRGTTMNMSDGGFMCWFVGTSEYDIIEVTDNILKVRIIEDDTYSWYHTFTSVKPVQK